MIKNFYEVCWLFWVFCNFVCFCDFNCWVWDKIILIVFLNFIVKFWIMVLFLFVLDLDCCFVLGYFIKKYLFVIYVLEFELDYIFIKDIKNCICDDLINMFF